MSRSVRRLLPLNPLRAFEAAARHLSFTRAADELGVTQGAVSRHIRALEERLGFPLFVRTAQGHVQEAQRIEQRLGCMPERFEKCLLRDLGSACTIGVPAHPVDHHKQNRMLGDSRDDTILVFFARPEQ